MWFVFGSNGRMCGCGAARILYRRIFVNRKWRSAFSDSCISVCCQTMIVSSSFVDFRILAHDLCLQFTCLFNIWRKINIDVSKILINQLPTYTYCIIKIVV